ncbi:PucR family transcriptional regulator [Nocardia sp. NBC_01388]|uniref:PucR family transcriptional regulator n=1 Tax=Nocardia sp. NBC_01388 TaxID=2903596 RepID=UPI0032498D63
MLVRNRDRALEQLYRRAVAARDELPTAVPPYRTLPQSLVVSGLERGTKLNVDLFFDFLRTGVNPSEDDTREVVDIALGRVRDGEPLEEVLGRYRLGAEYIWSRIRAAAAESERELLTDAALPLLSYLTLLTARIATACVQRAHDPRWELLERRRAIADALITGRDPIEWADEPAIAVPDAFVIAVFRLGTGAGGTRHGADTSELRHRIEAIPGVFLRLDSGGWTALLPRQPGDDGTATLAALTTRLLPAHPIGQADSLPGQFARQPESPAPRTPPPAPFWVGVTVASSRAEIPELFAEARMLAELGRCLDRSQMVCRRTDLMFEYTVAAGGSARTGLAAVLAPLDSQPLLAETLEVFVDTGFNQLATARLLNIHRNTVTYRLARIHELTRLDPLRPTDAMTLSAARIARRLESASFAP